jgi:hypothetical protein
MSQLNEQMNLSQFVSRVLSFTSQYSDSNWSAGNLIGPPRLNNIYGDSVHAWCPSTNTDQQVLELGFERSVYIKAVRIYENYNGGAVTKIEVFNGSDYQVLWSSEVATVRNTYEIFSPPLAPIDFSSNQIRLTMTLLGRDVFSEIDAVELVGSLVKFAIPKKTLSNDMSEMLRKELYTDLEVEVVTSEFGSRIHKVHRCILASRSKPFFDFLAERNFKLENVISDLEFKLVLEFIYTENLNETILAELVEATRQQVNSGQHHDQVIKKLNRLSFEELERAEFYDESTVLDFESDAERWMLTVNKLMRNAIRFRLERLEKLLLGYLINKFLTIDNVLNILMDSVDGVETSSRDSGDLFGVDFGKKFKLVNVEEACLNVIKLNIKVVIQTSKFKYLNKALLIKIARYI